MKGKLEGFIDKHKDELDLKMPDAKVLDRVLLEMFKKNRRRRRFKTILFQSVRYVAAACLVISIGIFLWKREYKPIKTEKLNKLNQVLSGNKTKLNEEQIASNNFQSPVMPQNGSANKLTSGTSKLTSNISSHYELELVAKLEQNESPANQINELMQTDQLKALSNDLVEVLFKILNNDPNTNVRLAALQSLTRFYNDNRVKKLLIKSLENQQDPMVQIALIRLLTHINDPSVSAQLEQVIKDEKYVDAVKETAYIGINTIKKI